MKRLLPLFLFIAGNVTLFLILYSFFPKYHGMLISLLTYLLMDLYLWWSVKRELNKLKTGWRYIVQTLYWLPLILLVSLIVYAQFHSFITWNVAIRSWLVSLFFITFFSKLLPVVSLILADLIRIIRGYIRKGKGVTPAIPIDRDKWLLKTGWISGLLLWLTLFAGMIHWVYDFQVVERDIYLRKLPAGFDGYRIVHLSDLHLGSWTRKSELSEATHIVNSLKPDLIVVTGDVFNFSAYEGEEFVQILSTLHAPDGIFCVPGNHDYGDYVRWPTAFGKEMNRETMELFFRRCGWTLLRNESRIVQRQNDSLALLGVENWGDANRFQKLADIDAALRKTPGGLVRILLSHDPSYWEKIILPGNYTIDLTLSGHTHGGQFGFRCRDQVFSPASLLSEYWLGHYSVTLDDGQPRQLYVNAGLGSVGYSGRVGIRPEITVLMLRPEKNSSD